MGWGQTLLYDLIGPLFAPPRAAYSRFRISALTVNHAQGAKQRKQGDCCNQHDHGYTRFGLDESIHVGKHLEDEGYLIHEKALRTFLSDQVHS